MGNTNNNEHDHEHGHGHDCDCGHEHVQYMTLRFEDDTEVRCAVVGIFEVEEIKGKEYIALVPDNSEEAYIYEYVETDNEDGFELCNIETDEEFDIVEEAFMAMLDEDVDDEEYDIEELEE